MKSKKFIIAIIIFFISFKNSILANENDRFETIIREYPYKHDTEDIILYPYNTYTVEGTPQITISEKNAGEFQKGYKYYSVIKAINKKNYDITAFLKNVRLDYRVLNPSIKIIEGDLIISKVYFCVIDDDDNILFDEKEYKDLNEEELLEKYYDTYYTYADLENKLLFSSYYFEVLEESNIKSKIKIKEMVTDRRLSTYFDEKEAQNIDSQFNYYMIEANDKKEVVIDVPLYIYLTKDRYNQTFCLGKNSIKNFSIYDEFNIEINEWKQIYTLYDKKIQIKSKIDHSKKLINFKDFLKELYYKPENIAIDNKKNILSLQTDFTLLKIYFNENKVSIFDVDERFIYSLNKYGKEVKTIAKSTIVKKQKKFSKKDLVFINDEIYVSPEVFEFILTK